MSKKVERYLMKSFEDKETAGVSKIVVPQGAVFLKAKVIHDGIYAWYEIPALITPQDQKEEFVILKPEQDIPVDAVFVDVLDVIVDTPQGQGVMIFPIYKIKT